MKKDMPLEGLRWSRDSGSALYDTPPNGRSRTGWGGAWLILLDYRRIIIKRLENEENIYHEHYNHAIKPVFLSGAE